MPDSGHQGVDERSWMGQMVDSIFEYQTLKIVNIGNKKIGLLNRVLQLTILIYIFGYVIIYQKGYQQFSPYNSATTSKLKGVISTLDLEDSEFIPEVPNKKAYKRVWDVPELVVPPTEADAFFITTNLIMTKQKMGFCPEDYKVMGVRCRNETECEPGRVDMFGSGVQTGNCVAADDPTTSVNVCEIRGWCPPELDRGPLAHGEPLFVDIINFTVLLKNYVEFPIFDIKLRNIREDANETYLKTCIYDPVLHPGCPIFRIRDILEHAGASKKILRVGGVVRIVVNWNCNFDYDVRYCTPTYEFLQIDDPEAKVAKGWNFRYIDKYEDGLRVLYKAYGISFRISTQARAGKFYMVNLAVNLGSGLGLLALTTIVCDLVILNCMKRREIYKKNKFRIVNEFTEDCEDSVNYERSSKPQLSGPEQTKTKDIASPGQKALPP